MSITNKPPCGMRDLGPREVLIRRKIFERCRRVFSNHHGQEIETPVLELQKIVNELYGEEFDKLVYNLTSESSQNDKDSQSSQSNIVGEMSGESERLILRYDLTVPLARYLANNGINKGRFYRIGKVYRKDHPQIKRGRYREFYQCDFDLVGDGDELAQDIEILTMVKEVLAQVLPSSPSHKDNNTNYYSIRFNSRLVLDGLLEKCQIPSEKRNLVVSSIDKLDKHPWDYIANELGQKGIDAMSIQLLKVIVEKFAELNVSDNSARISTLQTMLGSENDACKYISNLNTYLEMVCNLGIVPNGGEKTESVYFFDPLLARGMDYYTGLIFEANEKYRVVGGSSVLGGGRYNKMLGKLSSKGDIPCVGFSLGVERIATIWESKASEIFKEDGIGIHPRVFIASVGKNMAPYKAFLAGLFTNENISVDYFVNSQPRMKQQIEHTLDMRIPYMIIVGDDEVRNSEIHVKQMALSNEAKTIEVTFPMKELPYYFDKFRTDESFQ